MKSIGAEFLRPDAFPGIDHMRGMQYQIILNMVTNIVLQSSFNISV